MRHASAIPVLVSIAIAAHPADPWEPAVGFDAPASYLLEPDGVPEAIACGDLDGDGRLDLVVTNTGAGTAGGDSVSVLLGSGDARFLAGKRHAVGRRPEGIALLDADRDGILDVATSDFEGDSVSLLRGWGDGSFETAARIAVAGGPRSLATADVDADGRPDLVTSNYRGGSVSVLLGDGAGGFAVHRTIPVGNGPEFVVVADLDGDAFLDAATCDALSSTVSSLRGAPGGSFSPGATVRVGERPRAIVAGDLDGDGLDDLVVAEHDASTVSVLRNQGGHAFSIARTIEMSVAGISLRGPVGLDLADVDRDGGLDILVAWAASDTVTIHAGSTTPFSFRLARSFETGRNPVGVACRDLDGDGDSDLAVTNALAGTLDVHRSLLSDSARPFRRGDANGDGALDLADAIFVLNFLFAGGRVPGCVEAANSNDDEGVNITDAIFVLYFLFLGGDAPPPPGPPQGSQSGCGPDPPGSVTTLPCVEYEC